MSNDENGLTPLAFSQQACINNDKIYEHPSQERGAPYREAQSALLLAGRKDA